MSGLIGKHLIGGNRIPVGKSRLRNFLVVLALATLPAISGCVAYGHSAYAVPLPPTYADHGTLYYYDDVVLVFDAAWNGWAVRGHPHHYYYGDHYYRWSGGRWDRSRHFGRGWNRANVGSVPPRLHRNRSHRRHRHSAVDARDGRREATHERRGEGREARGRRTGGDRGVRSATTRGRPNVRHETLNNAGRDRLVVAQKPRNNRPVAVRERRDNRPVVVQKRRDDRPVVAQERRDDRRVVAQAPREDRRAAAKKRRRESRQPVQERREKRHRKGQKKTGASQKAEETVAEPTEVEFAGRQGRSRFQRGRSR